MFSLLGRIKQTNDAQVHLTVTEDHLAYFCNEMLRIKPLKTKEIFQNSYFPKKEHLGLSSKGYSSREAGGKTTLRGWRSLDTKVYLAKIRQGIRLRNE